MAIRGDSTWLLVPHRSDGDRHRTGEGFSENVSPVVVPNLGVSMVGGGGRRGADRRYNGSDVLVDRCRQWRGLLKETGFILHWRLRRCGALARFHFLYVVDGQNVPVVVVLCVERTATRATVNLPFWLSGWVGGEVAL